MSKTIPVFYLPKKYPEDMRIIAEGLVANDGQTVKSTVLWLQGKLIAHEGKKAGNPMSDTNIKNYLAGFYVLDLFNVNNSFYRNLTLAKRASVTLQSKIEVIQSLKLVLEATSLESFEEKFTQLCCQYSHIVKIYNSDRQLLKEKYGLPESPSSLLLQQLLTKYCDYSYIGNPGIGYLNRFYADKIEIDTYISLFKFIINNYQEYANKNMGLVPISHVLNRLKELSYYRDDEIKNFLVRLRITNRIELRMTKAQLAKNLGIELIDIQGIKYGFIKILDYNMVG